MRALPTIQAALAANAKVIVMSHLGRPEEGQYQDDCSLQPVATRLAELLNCQVALVHDYLQGCEPKAGEVLLLENVRLNIGETANAESLSKQLANLCDVFVMDAFATAHRAQASTYGVAKYAPIACAGPLLVEELTALANALDNPKRPLVAIVGGAKVSSKIQLLDRLLEKVDKLIVGGGIANTFLKAAGHPIGKSLYEPDFIEQTKALLTKADKLGVELPLPVDVAVATEFAATASATYKNIATVVGDELILDIGEKTTANYTDLLKDAETIIWNGPVGVFEFAQFCAGTKALAQAIAASGAYSLAGGGDTIAAINQFALAERISYICTGGGAFLVYAETGTLPAVEILQQRAQHHDL